ncbi:hypothetical protein E9228_001493 [Curtobacterium flaccumfaciens]|uniref:Uncharacterized protein n=1 Tax=Curtobacterium salicis TaxID=1779862 RepID=A0ABX0T728_9MICO|nr:hypothetical protein [Curtobacterium sp. WW7]NII40857.1 hypothetical protein [Curtobacterium sp. WW7]
MDEAVLFDLCSRARLVHLRTGGADAGLRGLTDCIAAASGAPARYPHMRLAQLIESAPRPVGHRYSLRQLESVSTSRTAPPEDYSGEQRRDYEKAQTALLRAIGKDSGDPPSGPVAVARNVLEQFVLRWF